MNKEFAIIICWKVNYFEWCFNSDILCCRSTLWLQLRCCASYRWV